MTYGTIKVDTVTFTDAGIDKSVTLSGLVQNPTFSGNVTVTGTLSGVTVTGTTANFTSGNFTNISGGTHTITSGVFAAGSAASPSITFTGDLNTGIYSPGADQVAISTGGSGRLFVDASGNVSVGTTATSGFGRGVSVDGTTFSYYDLYADGTLLGRVRSGLGQMNVLAQGASTDLILGTQNTERLRITSAGLVGIGTTSPGWLLSIRQDSSSGAAGAYPVVQINNPNATGFAGLYLNDSTAQAGLETRRDTAHLGFYAGGSEKARLDSSGRLGIGTTLPQGQLHVVTTNDGTAIRLSGGTTDSNNGGIAQLLAAGPTTGWHNLKIRSWETSFEQNGSEAMRIDSSRRLLVGTSSTVRDSRLCVRGNASGTFTGDFELGAAAGYASISVDNTIGVLRFTESTNGGIFAQLYAESDGTPGNNDYPGRLVFSTTADGASSPTERLRIDSAGQIEAGSLGTAAAPVWSFLSDTNTGIYSPGADQVAISTNGTRRLSIDSNGYIYGTASALSGDSLNTNGIGFFGGGVKQQSTVGYDFTQFYTSSGQAGPDAAFFIPASNSFGIKTAGSERLRITSAGLVGVGTSSPTNTLHLSGTNGVGTRIDNTSLGISAYLTLESSGGLQANISGSGFFSWVTGGGEKVRIDSSGRLGIGTTSPQGLCDVAGSNGRLVLANGNTSGGMKITATNSGYNANGYLAFEGYSSEYGRFDSSGRLLVGTSSAKTAARPFFGPSTPVTPVSQIEGYQIYTDEASRCFMLRGNSASDIYPFFALVRSKGTALGSNAAVANGDNIGALSFQGMDGTNAVEAASIVASVDGTPGANDMPGRLVFSTTADGASSPTERMRITNGGEILFGASTTTNGCKLALVNTNATRKWGFGTIGTSTYFAVVDDTTGAGVQLNAGSTSWSTFSDERLKDNLIPIQDGLGKVSRLRAVTGRYKTDDTGMSRSFLIAQDVQAVLPEAVDVMSDDMGTLSLKYTEVIPLLVSALKESKERIETLEAKVAALESA